MIFQFFTLTFDVRINPYICGETQANFRSVKNYFVFSNETFVPINMVYKILQISGLYLGLANGKYKKEDWDITRILNL